MKYILWTKNGCSYCVMAKRLLDSKKLQYEERNIGDGTWGLADMYEAVPGAKTVPQIFEESKYIGGYTDLRSYLSSKEQN